MVDPIPETRNVSEIGEAESLSQASAFSAANDHEDAQEVPAQFQKLRHYILQMQGMILDTEA
jgi:hypothetical protein